VESRKVQRLGPSTLATTLPADWTAQNDVAKGDDLSLRLSDRGTITVFSKYATAEDREITIAADPLDGEALERAIVAQYALGRRVIQIETAGDTLRDEHVSAVQEAEKRLVGLGVIDETLEYVALRCSADPGDFSLPSLLGRLNTTATMMRTEAVLAFSNQDSDRAAQVLNRERRANRIFVLILRIIFMAHSDLRLTETIGLDAGLPLVGYRSVAKNLELSATTAEDVARTVVDTGGTEASDGITNQIRGLNETVDDLTKLALEATLNPDFSKSMHVRNKFAAITDREREILVNVPELSNDEVLAIREVLVSLQRIAEYAMRNAEIAGNLSLNRGSEHLHIESQ